MPVIKAQQDIDWNYNVNGQGEPLVFLHGWGVDMRIWRQQCKYFLGKYRVVSFDLPGHGRSSWRRLELKDIAEDLNAVMDKLGLNEIITVGSSLGGLLSLKLFEISPKRFKKMIFVGSIPKFAKSENYPFGLDIAQIRKLGGQLDTSYPSIVNIFFRSLFTKEERATRRYKWMQKFRQFDEAPIKPALIEYLDILKKEDLTDVLKNVDVPIQFINGQGDTICNAAAVNFLKELLPGARFDVFEKCGHFPFLSKPHEFNNVLEEFLVKG